MSPGYKTDEKVLHTVLRIVLQSIIQRNCKVQNPTQQLKLNIYYKSPKTSSLILRNNVANDNSPLKQTNVIYHYKCTTGECALLPNSGYVGMTTTSLSRRLTMQGQCPCMVSLRLVYVMHLQNGGPLTHTTEKHHHQRLTRQTLTANTTILARGTNTRHLTALEAVYIRDMDPLISKQGTLSL